MKGKKLRIIAILLVLVVSLMMLTSCSGEDTQKDTSEKPVAASESAEEPIAVGQVEEPSTAVSESEREPADTGEINTVTKAAEEAENLGNFKVFSSDVMNFSFLYDPAHTAHVTETGAAELAINGDESLVGLFVSVADASNLPTPGEILEEKVFNLQQRYQNAMAEQPETETEEIQGHKLIGIIYAYSDTEGKTVDCTEWIEVRDGKYIFFNTAAYRPQSGPELEALGAAMATLEFSPDAWGAADAANGTTVEDAASANTEAPADEDWGRADDAPLYLNDMNSGFYFEADDSYLIISDENTTQVYVNGVMSGDYYVCSRVVLDDDIGNTVVNRKNEVMDFLQNRIATPPEIVTLEIGDRRIAGIEYAYSATDGSKTICAAEYYEYIGDEVYNWYTVYDKGTTKAPDALQNAMETFTLS